MIVVNLVVGSGSTTLPFDGQTLGTVNFGDKYPARSFIKVFAGSKNLKAALTGGASKTCQIAAPTEFKFRVFLFSNTTDTEANVLIERYIWQTKSSKDGSFLFLNGNGKHVVFKGSTNATLEELIVGADMVDFYSPFAAGSSIAYLLIELC